MVVHATTADVLSIVEDIFQTVVTHQRRVIHMNRRHIQVKFSCLLGQILLLKFNYHRLYLFDVTHQSGNLVACDLVLLLQFL